jgi:hypothetical protein
VWTAFVFGYLALGSITAMALAIAASGLMVRGVDLSWALWSRALARSAWR